MSVSLRMIKIYNQSGKRKVSNKSVLIFLLLFLLQFLLLPSLAYGLGVAPSRNVIDHSEGSQSLVARVINNEQKDMTILITFEGELAKYASIEKPLLKISKDEGEKQFSYSINLPKDLQPGERSLDVVLTELPGFKGENIIVTGNQTILVGDDKQSPTMSATVAVKHQLRVNVPYPGLYAEGILYITESQVNDTTTFSVAVFNRGKEDVNVYADIAVKGPLNDEIATIKTDSISLKPSEQGKLSFGWIANVNQGIYFAEVTVHYNDKYFVLRKPFNIGNLYISIDDIDVSNFKLGSIAKFDINLKNKWNQDINDIEGTVKVMDEKGSVLTDYKTNKFSMTGLSDKLINAYWDTANAQIGKYDVEVTLNYAGKTTQKIFPTIVSIDNIEFENLGAGAVIAGKGGGMTSILVIVVIILVIVNIGWFVFMKRILKKKNQE